MAADMVLFEETIGGISNITLTGRILRICFFHGAKTRLALISLLMATFNDQGIAANIPLIMLPAHYDSENIFIDTKGAVKLNISQGQELKLVLVDSNGRRSALRTFKIL